MVIIDLSEAAVESRVWMREMVVNLIGFEFATVGSLLYRVEGLAFNR